MSNINEMETPNENNEEIPIENEIETQNRRLKDLKKHYSHMGGLYTHLS